MIHDYSSQPVYDLLHLINDVEKKSKSTAYYGPGVTRLVCGLCGGEKTHFGSCELDKMRKIIKALECGDD